MIRPLEIEGFACPYGPFNSFNEAMAPGAFDAFIKSLDGKHVPMGLMHNRRVGYWDRLESRKDGLWCHGFIVYPPAIADRQWFPELSITWGDAEKRGLSTNRRIQAWEEEIGFVPASKRAGAVEKLVVRNATLAEISLVDEGAFAGTFWHDV